MPLYTRPGVYVEEYLNPLSEVTFDPGDASAAFVGVSTGGGPAGPVQVTSWSQFQSLFGTVAQTNDDLGHAVYNFFANGGTGCYVVRAINADAVAASLTLNDSQTPTPAAVLKVTALAPGTWANSTAGETGVYVTTAAGSAADRFDLVIEVGGSNTLTAREQFLDLSVNPADGRYYADIINSPVIGSKFVSVAPATGYVYNSAAPKSPAAVSKAPLAGGANGTGTPDVSAAVTRLDTVDRNLVVNLPNGTSAQVTSAINWAITSGRHFIVADVPKPASGETAAASVTAMTAFADGLPNSSHVAVYGPWLYTVDPGSKAGAMRLTAPGGAVVGQYLRTDAFRGVHKAPAGIQTRLVGVVSPYTNFTNPQQDSLHTSGVNLIKQVPGAGISIMGARTQGNGFPDRYVPVRRLLISFKSALTSVTRFAVFENNDEDLRSTLEDVVTNYLQQQFDLGALQGNDPSEGFYVICDDTNNTPADADAGIVNIEVGVALKHPAEFIVIRLGQTSAGATATDSLEEE